EPGAAAIGAPIAGPAEVVADEDALAETGVDHVADERDAPRLRTIFGFAEAIIADIDAELGDALVIRGVGIAVHVAEGDAMAGDAVLHQRRRLLIAHRSGGGVGDHRSARFAVRGGSDANELPSDLVEVVVLGA